MSYTGDRYATVWGPDGKRYRPQDDMILSTLYDYWLERVSGRVYREAFFVAVDCGRLRLIG